MSTAEEISSFMDRLFNNDYNEDEPGASVAILMDDRLIYKRCIGLANIDTHEKITFDTNFRLASLTKQFIAYGIILLEQENMLSRNDKIGKFFPDKFKARNPFLSNRIIVQHLLDHSSGLYDYEESYLQSSVQWSDHDVLESLHDKTYFEPGTQYRYSNTGYILLGLIIESASSKTLEDFLQEYICQPNHMKAAVFNNPSQTAIKNRALGYAKNLGQQNYELLDQSPTSATRGDGGIYMSVNDYLQWYRHCQPPLLMPLFPIDNTASTSFYYSLGWFLADNEGRIRLHSGHSCGFTHQVFRIDTEQRKVLVLYLTNIGSNNKKLETFNRFIVENIPELNPDNTGLLWKMNQFTR